MGSPEAERRPMLLVYLYVTIFLTSMAYGTITFLVPVYAEELGASYVTLGVLGAVGSVVYTVMTLVSGFLLDRFERVRFYLGTTALGILVILLFSFTTSISQLMLVRGTLGIVAATFWVTASTLTADISPPEALTRSVGRYN
ncbi:MAG TPA: MFS transporter, partial [Patescibacteria group bacterium]|nr:MFS transporter [Patescibacteria group bacterium]